ncbi:MarR family transcriptional regulator [Streptomyces sp. NPDC047108]|uniref:MarR family transcriptional regulator n=1 Tax=Streptomyces sp. NPDC047108 TaxID=3155025 RepID=UPI0033BFDC04
MHPAAAPRRSLEAAGAAREVIELLEVLWERGRTSVPTAPVSSSQLRVLHILDRDEGINLRTLGLVLGAAPSSVSRLCDRLQVLGLVERGASPASRREVDIRLSERGEAYLADLRARREEALLLAIGTMTAAARDALVEGLAGFRAAVEETDPVRGRAGPPAGSRTPDQVPAVPRDR